MFKLIKNIRLFKTGKLRLGFYSKGKRDIQTPCYFFISNLGGGGTNVSRLVTYMDLFETGESQLLMNYYYLNVDFKKTMGFDTAALTKLKNKEDMLEFLKETRKDFIKKGKVVPEHKFGDTNWNPELLLDSGSGNIFRDLIKNRSLSSTSFKSIYEEATKNYLNFGKIHHFDILIAMDIAGKYTHKQGEDTDDNYRDSLESFRNGSNNIELLKITLNNLTDEKLMVFAPLHGKTPTEYLEHLKNIILLENRVGKKFSGFALGGLGSLPDTTSYEICRFIRSQLDKQGDDRPIHVLGVGSLQNLIPMCMLGIDSFDCHSPWRRASEGKFVIPLINSNGKIITSKTNFWKYVSIQNFDKDDFTCNCEICNSYSLKELKDMYSKGGEFTYLAKIIFFKHNISQQEFALRAIREGKLEKVIEEIPKGRYKEFLTAFMNTLK